MPQGDAAAGTMERLLAVKALPMFADVHPDELAAIAEVSRPCAYRRGEALYGPESERDAIHLVLEGRVTEYRSGRAFATHGPQRIVGGEDALARCASNVSAVADEDTRTLAVERPRLRDALEDNFGVLSAVLRALAGATLRLRRRLRPSAGYPAATSDGSAAIAGGHELGARIAFLCERTWLQALQVDAVGQLAREAAVIVLDAGRPLWRPGDSPDGMLVVTEGEVACTTGADGHRFAVGPGAILGFEEAVSEDARWCKAIARRPGYALRLTRTALLDVLEDAPDSALALLSAVATLAAGLRDAAAWQEE